MWVSVASTMMPMEARVWISVGAWYMRNSFCAGRTHTALAICAGAARSTLAEGPRNAELSSLGSLWARLTGRVPGVHLGERAGRTTLADGVGGNPCAPGCAPPGRTARRAT